MNKVILMGRLTRDPEVRYSSGERSMAIARYTLAVDRIGKDKGADSPRCIAFGKTAEVIEKYIRKGSQIGITGHLQTGSYEKDGRKVYTTDVLADRIEFIDFKDKGSKAEERPAEESPVEGFARLSDEIPF